MNRLFLSGILCAIAAQPVSAQTVQGPQGPIQIPIQVPIQNPLLRCIQQPTTCGDFPQIYSMTPSSGQPVIRVLRQPAVIPQPISDYGSGADGLGFGSDYFPTW